MTEGKFIAAVFGSFDDPARLELAQHILVDVNGDYHELNDGLPQRAQ